MPLELLEKHELSTKVDVYSFGILMWECFTGEVSALPCPGACPTCTTAV
jgi:hypothetical protein